MEAQGDKKQCCFKSQSLKISIHIGYNQASANLDQADFYHGPTGRTRL